MSVNSSVIRGLKFDFLKLVGRLIVDESLTVGEIEFPSQDGLTGQVLMTNGAGLLTFSTISEGDTYGPSSSVDNAIVTFDGVSGKLLQNSSAFVDDSGKITAPSMQIAGINYPTVDGTTDQLLTTDGAGNLSFSSLSTLSLPLISFPFRPEVYYASIDPADVSISTTSQGVTYNQILINDSYTVSTALYQNDLTSDNITTYYILANYGQDSNAANNYINVRFTADGNTTSVNTSVATQSTINTGSSLASRTAVNPLVLGSSAASPTGGTGRLLSLNCRLFIQSLSEMNSRITLNNSFTVVPTGESILSQSATITFQKGLKIGYDSLSGSFTLNKFSSYVSIVTFNVRQTLKTEIYWKKTSIIPPKTIYSAASSTENRGFGAGGLFNLYPASSTDSSITLYSSSTVGNYLPRFTIDIHEVQNAILASLKTNQVSTMLSFDKILSRVGESIYLDTMSGDFLLTPGDYLIHLTTSTNHTSSFNNEIVFNWGGVEYFRDRIVSATNASNIGSFTSIVLFLRASTTDILSILAGTGVAITWETDTHILIERIDFV